ncbi:MAG: transporter [Alphaproteobacteria bacterium]|nr:transporter [Alphaproteobacteria bacterium]
MNYFTWFRSPAHFLVFICLVSTLAALGAKDANAQKTWSAFKFSTGVDYTTGDYGTGSNTDILFIPFTGKYEHGPWVVGMTIPYIHIDGDGSVVGGTDGSPIVGDESGGGRTVKSGLGDIVALLTYSILPKKKTLPLVELTGKIKFPTANENDGLGTGEFDYSVQVDISQKFGKITPFGTLGYRFVGEPSGTNLNDIFFLSLGGSYALQEKWSAGLIFDYRQSTSDAADDPAELTPFVVWKVHKDWSLNTYGLIGLTDGSADYGGGLQVSYTLER